MGALSPADALIGFAIAFAVAALLTPVAARLARLVGAIDEPRERGMAEAPTPRLGGLAILAGVLLAGSILLPATDELRGVLVAAAIIALVGAVDDCLELPASWKLSGQFLAATVCVLAGVRVEDMTLPFAGRIELAEWGGPLTLIGLVVVMNVVNLSDGVDGLAAGVCAIAAAAFAVIAFDLGTRSAGVLAAIVAGAALGFLLHNFPPASVFMGDCGSNLLGLLLGAAAVQGTLKTNAVVALFVPLVILAVPFLDTGFVVAKRIKYRRPVHRADMNHFHHRFYRIGFSSRRTVAYLYGWTAIMAGLAVGLRFIPYSERSGELNLAWFVVLAACGLLAIAASVYLVLVLEILKLRRIRSWQLRRVNPRAGQAEVDAAVERDLETGEFPRLDLRESRSG